MKLTSLVVGSGRTINGKNVVRISEDKVSIDGQELSISSANKVLKIKNQFDDYIYVMVEPPHRVISTHTVCNDEEYTKLVENAKRKRLCLYFAEYKERDGRYIASQPWLLDYNTLVEPKNVAKPKPLEQPIESKSDDLVCPYCKKIMSSSSGLTLHIKSKHAKGK